MFYLFAYFCTSSGRLQIWAKDAKHGCARNFLGKNYVSWLKIVNTKPGHRDGQVLQSSWMEIRQVVNLPSGCMFWVHPSRRGKKTPVTIFAGKGSANEPDDTKSSIWIRRHFDRPCVWFGLYFVIILTHAEENCFTTINWRFLSFFLKPLFTWKEDLGKCFTERKETTGN